MAPAQRPITSKRSGMEGPCKLVGETPLERDPTAILRFGALSVGGRGGGWVSHPPTRT